MAHDPSRIVLVTGGSRGIGADVARQLADADTHVIVNYRQTADRADALVASIRAAGGHASTLAADISDEAAAVAMVDTIAWRFGRLDALVLTASGGLQLGADPRYAMRLNRDGQRRLAQLAVPVMPVNGRIVYVTSHQAHFFPNKGVPVGYGPVAASKRAGETALYAMRSTFERAGVRFTVVSGDMIDGSIATAVVGAINAPHPSGMVFVGGADFVMTA